MLEAVEPLAAREHLVVEPLVPFADVRSQLSARKRRAALETGQVPGGSARVHLGQGALSETVPSYALCRAATSALGATRQKLPTTAS